MMTATQTGRIYVASLSDYNAGRLHGEWIDVPTDADELMEAITAILATSPEPIAEEWAIHDYDGFPNLGEYPSIDRLCAIAEVLEEVNENALGDAFLAWIDGDSYRKDHPEKFQDAYLGTYDSEEDYAREYIESTGMLDGVNESIANYFDYEAFARDLFMDLDRLPAGFGQIYVFDPNA